jgi:protein TonB
MARDGLRSHLSGSVPLSIAAHVAFLVLLLIFPLAAEVSLPVAERGLPDFVRVAPPPPLPPESPVRAPHAVTTAPPSPSIPVIAPPSIAPERPDPGPQLDVPIAPAAGLPSGVGEVEGLAQPPATPPPDVARPSPPIRVALLPQAPRKLVDVRPAYPDIARNARVDGTVILEAVVDTNGSITKLRVVRSVPLLDQAALDAVRQWRYAPSVYGGRPVSVLLTITVRFTLQ